MHRLYHIWVYHMMSRQHDEVNLGLRHNLAYPNAIDGRPSSCLYNIFASSKRRL